MGWRMPDADSIDDRRSGPEAIRPVVLLALDDDEIRARFAFQLAASGFDVAVTQDAAVLHALGRADVVVAALSARRPGAGLSVEIPANNPRLRGIPLIAVARDASDATRDLARQEGCAAVCVTTCSGAALAAGIRAVLERSRQ
jgi:DNA-binding response OmpR family regulator